MGSSRPSWTMSQSCNASALWEGTWGGLYLIKVSNFPTPQTVLHTPTRLTRNCQHQVEPSTVLYFLPSYNFTGSKGSVKTQGLVCTDGPGFLKRQPWSVSMKHSSRIQQCVATDKRQLERPCLNFQESPCPYLHGSWKNRGKLTYVP